MPRYASIDIGTNTVKLLIAEREGGDRFVRVHEASRTTRLGEGMHGGRLLETAMRRTLDVLADYAGVCAENQAARVSAVGTAALRAASNRDDFVGRAREAGVRVEVISGDEEARLSYLAVRRDPLWRAARDLLVVDIGGGSTEVITGRDASITRRTSLPMGAVRLTEDVLRGDPPTIREMAAAKRATEEALGGLGGPAPGAAAVGVGGTFTNMAAVDLCVVDRSADRLHGAHLTPASVEAQVALYASRTVAERTGIAGLDPARADIILGGALILSQVLSRLQLDDISVSVRGLRWGVLYDRFGWSAR